MIASHDPARIPAQGLYHPDYEHESCGVGFIADLKNRPSHKIIQQGLEILLNLDHRGAVGADPKLGDGCGILVQIPDRFFREEWAQKNISLPPLFHYGVGHFFMPRLLSARQQAEAIINNVIEQEGMVLIGWRDVPVDSSDLGETVKATEPFHRQVFIGRGPDILTESDFERRLYVLRKVVSNALYGLNNPHMAEYYPVSLSCRTLVYKGMILVTQLFSYYKDLQNPLFESALALVHQRFATNTFPSWRLAHPYRYVAHNGEINTLRGNVNWMAARQASAESKLFGADISRLWPISYEGQSDTACFDNALEFLVQGGYSLAQAMMMMIPEAWAGNPLMDQNRRAFYEYCGALMEPWDGPASMAFTDGHQIGATLDRNGLRPARYLVTRDNLVVLASEIGVLPIPEEEIVVKWRLQPGKMLLVDLDEGRIISDDEIKTKLATAHPYQAWLDRTQIVLEDLPPVEPRSTRTDVSLFDRQKAFGYTQEDLDMLLAPMLETGQEAVGSMGTDTPLSVLSQHSKLLYTYFKQNFAQVTNPPIDPIREELVMSLVSFIGPRPNIFDLEGSSKRKRLEVRQPILTNEDLEKIRSIGYFEDSFDTRTLDMTYAAQEGADVLQAMLDRLCQRAEQAVRSGYNIIILSDRLMGPDRIPIPALLATAAVHHHLIRKGLRTAVGLVVETGEAREVHHFCCLAGYGAEAINPYLVFEILNEQASLMDPPVSEKVALQRFISSIDKGLLKVMSKMGISTYQSYCGAQIFDAVGLEKSFVTTYFTGTHTAIEGVGLSSIQEEMISRHKKAFAPSTPSFYNLPVGGEYAYRKRGEDHAWNPESVAHLQHAVRSNSKEIYQKYKQSLDEKTDTPLTLRSLLHITSAEEAEQHPIALEEVEPAKEIVKRFSTGAMSFGSISREAHTTLAIAMNRIGGKSNTGEGGEEPDRFEPLPNGDSQRSAIKQVASGRFGVTTDYLVNADVLQIKMAQGAKPGEGGQLPGFKVDAVIAKVRHSTQGVGLISPPPHHDIYSIEDLAQLIFDLKNVNPRAQVSVKLVSEMGVGTIAAGVAKARADHVTISGFEGGTGASPLTSIKHTGSPWEIGLAETHQTLVLNQLRARIAVQVDGGFRTGRDVIIGGLLGADEFGFATAPLIAAGCIMMRKCHLNTCPVGIATQDPVLRRRFAGQPEHVINFFFFIAEDVRQWMAQMGYRTFNELIGQSHRLIQKPSLPCQKFSGLDFSKLLTQIPVKTPHALRKTEAQPHNLADILDQSFIDEALPLLEQQQQVTLSRPIRNRDRAVGARLSGELVLRKIQPQLVPDSITLNLKGTAGQSLGAWLVRGVTLNLEGEANDYVGKGLSGGKIIVFPPREATHLPEQSIIVGNTVLYGATGGECYIRGVAGERFAVRNSGAVAVVEGTGDHGCEYMTGGLVVVLGPTGRNFAAGMSGGVAYVFDEEGTFAKRCNQSMVELDSLSLEQDSFLENPPLSEEEWEEVLTDLTSFDLRHLHHLILRHVTYTHSPRAQRILEHWEEMVSKFVKVMPVEYRRALEQMKGYYAPVRRPVKEKA